MAADEPGTGGSANTERPEPSPQETGGDHDAPLLRASPKGFGHTSSVPRVLGILSILLGALGTCTHGPGSCSSAALLGGETAPSDASVGSDAGDVDSAHARRRSPTEPRIRLGVLDRMINAADLAVAVVLIAVGVGQLRYRRWASRASVVWGIIALGLALLTAARYVRMMDEVDDDAEEYRVCRVDPHEDAGAPSVTDCEPLGGMPGGTTFRLVMGVTMALFMSAYPIVLIVAFRRPKVVSAMRT